MNLFVVVLKNKRGGLSVGEEFEMDIEEREKQRGQGVGVERVGEEERREEWGMEERRGRWRRWRSAAADRKLRRRDMMDMQNNQSTQHKQYIMHHHDDDEACDSLRRENLPRLQGFGTEKGQICRSSCNSPMLVDK